MSLDKNQKKQLKEWGIDPETIEDREDYDDEPEPKKDNTMRILSIVLAIALGAFLCHIAYIYFDVCPEENRLEIAEGASNYGYSMALGEVLNKTLECNGPVSINVGNVTHDIFAVECLNLNQEGGNK